MQGKEIDLTKIVNYIWCKNMPTFALMEAKEYGIERTYTFEEYVPEIVISKNSNRIIGNGKVFYIPDYLFEKLFGNYIKSYTLHSKLFSEIKDDIKLVMETRSWFDLTHYMGLVAENEFAKSSYRKTFMSTLYSGFLIKTIPDGIFDNTIYEFKTVQDNTVLEKQLKIAQLQADLICYLFGYDYIEVEVMSFEDMRIENITRKADFRKAEEILEEVLYNYENNLIYEYMDDFRCRNCKWINKCRSEKNEKSYF